MFKYCGTIANNYGYMLCTNIITYAHKPQFKAHNVFYAQKYNVFKLYVNSFVHNFFIQFLSVNNQLCTFCTSPTITTTYNK